MGPKNELSYAKWAGPAIPFGWDSCNTDAETFAESTASTYPATAPVTLLNEKETHCSIRFLCLRFDLLGAVLRSGHIRLRKHHHGHQHKRQRPWLITSGAR